MSAQSEQHVDLDLEELWSRGTAVGEAVWIRVCRETGRDPKAAHRLHGSLVETVRGCVMAIERGGLEGLADMLEDEEWGRA